MTPRGHRPVLQRFKDLLFWNARDRDIDEEMQFHVESLVQEHMRAGLAEDEARLAARRRFGSASAIKERGHDVRGAGLAEDVVREVRYAARRLAGAPVFASAAILTLALAVGGTAAIFTVVHRVVLNPLPYPDSSRLIDLDHGALGINVPSGLGLTAGLYRHYAERVRTLEAVAVFGVEQLTLAGGDAPVSATGARVTPSLLSVLRVAPAEGRWFTEAEGAPGAAPVAVLSHGLWMRRYGGDPDVVGRSMMLESRATEIIGVMPPSFAFPRPTVDIWQPAWAGNRARFGLPFQFGGVARMRAGVTIADVRAELDSLVADLPQAFPGDPGVLFWSGEAGLRSTAVTLQDSLVGGVAQALWILLAAAGVVLLVAAANVANLFLVRSESRQREVSVRRALGASGASIRRFFLAESLLLSMAGACAGLIVAWAAVQLLVATSPGTLPRLGEVRLDGVVVLFTIVLAVLVALAIGLIPLRARAPLAASLQEGGRSRTAGRSRHRMRHLLIGAQVALSFVLLVSSGLMIRSFQALRAIDPGFDAGSTLTFRIGLPGRDYPTRAAAAAAHQAIIDHIAALPGVTAVSAATELPLANACFMNGITVEGRLVEAADRAPGFVRLCATAGGHVEALGLRLLQGRALARDDVERQRPNVLVNQALADAYFSAQDPIGQRLRSNAPPVSFPDPDDASRAPDGGPAWLTIVGVVSNTPVRTLTEPDPVPSLYMPMSIAGGPDIPDLAMLGSSISAMRYLVRTAVPSAGLLPAVRHAVDEVDAGLALVDARTLQEILDRGSAQMAFTMALITIAAGVALLLGLVGIYGVIAYIVSQRTAEIGVRLALGAEPGSVVGLIVRQGAIVALAGVACGLGIALAGSQLIASLLYGVDARDPGVFAGAALVLFAMAIAACWLPARRAASVSPTVALRADS